MANSKGIAPEAGGRGYSRAKSGDLRRRSVTRVPDMSDPHSRVRQADVVLGSLPAVAGKKPASRSSAHAAPKVRTITDTRKESFPFSILFLALLCAVMFIYMIYNYVEINEHTSAVSKLNNQIGALEQESKDYNAKLIKKNDFAALEQYAKEELGMVKSDEIEKRYITMEAGEVISSFAAKP